MNERFYRTCFALALLMMSALAVHGQISISHLGTYATGSYNTSAAEIVAFDPVSDRIFFVNAQLNEVRALNVSSPATPTLAFSIPMGTYGAGANSVTVVPGGIAVAVEAAPKTDPGSVVFFDANGTFLSQVTVGALPDHVSVTPNGQKVLVANEGEPNTAYTIDPQGTISIIDISGGIAGVTAANVTTIDFTAYTPAMIPGVRIFGPGASVAQDMEPEYITVSDDSQKAFVTCQENNAVVRINLTTNTIEQITSLGLKDHSLTGNGLDASDSPTGINIANWPVKGLYMPDAADAFTIGGQTYVAYANEGDAREYTPLNEPRRIGNAAYVLDPVVFPNAATLKLNANLGRLNASISSGNLDADPEFEEIHVFGSRSFTIRDANGAIVWDSGDQLEQITATQLAANFNCNNSANGTFDTRSDDKGPEPEAIVVANVYGSNYAFVGLERIGGIVVYDVTVPSAPVFIQYLNHRNFAGNAAAGTALDLGLEDIKFVSAADSPDGQPFLITGNEISGTVSLFRINPPPYKLQILHASDFEASVPATDDAPRFASIVDQLEDAYTNTVKLSSGDNFLPGPFMSAGEDPSLQTPLRNAYINYYGGTFANNDLRAAIGRVDITILNILGIQASVLGNHEFDLGTSELRNIIGGVNSGAAIRWFGAQFPYLSSNLNFSGDANLSALFTATREQHTFFRSNPTQTAAVIAATKKLAPSTIITVNGEKIGVVGVTTQVLASISSPGATTVIGPSVNDMPALAAIVQPVINNLINLEGINKVILLSHLQQLSLEKALAPLLNGVDVIIAGGSHTLMADATDRLRTGDVAVETYPFLTTGLDGKPIAIINTTSEYKYVGRLVVDFNGSGDIVPASINPAISGAYAADSLGVVEAWGSLAAGFTTGSKGQEVKNLCDAVKNVIIAKDGNLFGKTSVFLEGRRNFVRTEETNLGNVSADANKWMARRYDPSVTISIKNGGGIRSAIGVVNAVGGNVSLDPPAANPLAGKAQGDISQLDIENSLRFNNLLSNLTLTAANLRTILEHGVAASGPGQTQGRFPQISGVRFSYNETLPANARILNAVITDSMGVTVDTLIQNGAVYGNPTRTFRVVTLNFLASGGDGYPFNTLGTGRVDLNTLPAQGPGLANFTTAGSEQDAFAEFMKSFHSVNPYALAETPASADERIQEVNDRPDCILPPRFFADTDGDGFGDPNNFITSCPGGAPSGYVVDNTDNCPIVFGRVGDSCSDGNALTSGDVLGSDCVCRGTCTANAVTLTLTTDNNGGQTSWEILPSLGGAALCSGSGYSSNSTITASCCLPNGCYNLRIYDSFGDGLASGPIGGWVLRDANNERILDNANDGVFSGASVQAPEAFCLPIGTDRLTAATCDQETVTSAFTLQVVENTIVTGQFGITNSVSGYQFWIYNPDGSYSRRLFLSHQTPGSSAPTGTAPALRASYLRLNTLTTNTVPSQVLLNVRVRARIAGAYQEFGPACRMKLDPTVNCQTTQLTTTADPAISCGASGLLLNGVDQIHANAVPGANRYQFRFTRPGFTRNIATNSRSLTLFEFTTNPLQLGLCYDVIVRASFDNGTTWCAFGASCQVCLGAAPPTTQRIANAVNASSVVIWPNPNDGERISLSVEIGSEFDGTAQVDVFDMFGKKVMARTIIVSGPSMNTTLELSGELASGLYMVNITMGEETFTERLIIQP
jgi:2',3'-cyclic-nucleotide 2'-phosphodiesterase / 3'-nucleotidase / 5'-nucleotidase